MLIMQAHHIDIPNNHNIVKFSAYTAFMYIIYTWTPMMSQIIIKAQMWALIKVPVSRDIVSPHKTIRGMNKSIPRME